MKWFCLAAGSCLGGFARYFLGTAVSRFAGAGFPYGTMTVNLAGCFLIGIFAVFSEEKNVLGPEARLFLMAGFCGAFTTFSALILESSQLARGDQILAAFINLLASAALGFLFFWAGARLAKIF